MELELVVAHRSERGAGFVYELAWDGAGRGGERFLIGLTDPASLASSHGYDDTRSGPEPVRSGPGRPLVGGWSAPGRTAPEAEPPVSHNGSGPFDTGGNGNGADPGGGHERVVAAASGRRAG